jgi:hypothetical protein
MQIIEPTSIVLLVIIAAWQIVRTGNAKGAW